MFYAFPGGLRFELSEGGSPLDQVLTALRKATVICGNVFDGEAPLLVHLQRVTPPGPHPNPGGFIYLLDPDRGIVVHPYDERGMDIVARRPSVLQELYDRHDALLPPHDMDAMRRTFGPPA